MSDPALVHSAAVAGKATHAFIVGIGHYPHLKGGGGQLAGWNFGLGQLSSTAASARRIASWLIDNFDCPVRPLSSVALLLSEPGAHPAVFRNSQTGEDHSVPRGTRLETRDALLAAFGRVTDADDQLLFYFAGHGLSGGTNDFYLLRDFGSDPGGPLDHMINYASLMSGLNWQLPSRQMLIFDGCRDVEERAEANQSGGSGLIVGDPQVRHGVAQTMLQCSLHSSERDAKSYGKAGEPSVCAEAFLRALSGAAGKRTKDGWEITSARLCDAMTDFQTLGYGPNAGIIQRPDPSAYKNFSIRSLGGPPRIPVFMRRRDGGSLEGSKVTCKVNGNPVVNEELVRESYWEGRLDIGPHGFEVQLADNSHCRPVTDSVAPSHLPIDLDLDVP